MRHPKPCRTSELQPTVAATDFDQGDETDCSDAGADQPSHMRIHRYLLSVGLSPTSSEVQPLGQEGRPNLQVAGEAKSQPTPHAGPGARIKEMREDRPRTQDLLELAEREGQPVKTATLASWRWRGLLPRPRRSPGARSRYLYPRGTDDQLRRLLYWRARSERLYLIAVALWVEGFPIRVGVIRGALIEFTVAWGKGVEQILSSQSEPEASSEALARNLARQRSRAPIPRLSRMRLADRERAYVYLMDVMLGLEEQAASRPQDLPHVQRLFGFRRGHDGGLADQFPLDDLEGLGRELLPSSAKPVLARASGAELELVRRSVAMVVNWLPRLGPAMLADEPVKALDLVTLIREFCVEPPAEVLALLAVVWLSSLQAKNPNEVELRAHIESLSPAAVEGELSALLPPDVSD